MPYYKIGNSGGTTGTASTQMKTATSGKCIDKTKGGF